jgi:hypothetical protein
MQLWEWVLTEDRRQDLAEPAAAVEWFAAHRARYVPFVLKWDKAGHPPWPKAVLSRWQANVNALRSLAARLHGRKVREADIDPIEADRLFFGHISGLRLRVDAEDKAKVGLEPLKASTFRGVTLSWDRVSVNDHPKLEPMWAMLASVQDAFWRVVFGSLATDEVPPVCSASGCGKPLDKTPGGRTPRAPMCKSCRYKAWYTAQPITKLRKRWAKNKRIERQRNQQGN